MPGADNQPEFDPYYHWLGIPAEDQPADHYRLLGLRRDERDPRVIESAADRQMNHVRTFQAGEHRQAAQRVLNELAAARLCLLNAEQKRAYDAGLRAKQQPAQLRPTATARPLASSPQVAGYPLANENAALDAFTQSAWDLPQLGAQLPYPARGFKTRKPFWKQPHWLAVIACGALGIVTVVVLLTLSGSDPPQAAHGNGDSQVVEPKTPDTTVAGTTPAEENAAKDQQAEPEDVEQGQPEIQATVANASQDSDDSSNGLDGVAVVGRQGEEEVVDDIEADPPITPSAEETAIRSLLANALVMFNFEEGTYARADDGVVVLQDLGPSDIYGRYYGILMFDQGIAGQAYVFDGKRQYVRMPELRPVLQQDRSSLTVSFWQRTDAAKFAMMFDCGFYPQRSLTVATRADKKIEVNCGPGNKFATTEPLEGGQWRHMVLVFSGDKLQLYVDGAELESWAIRPMKLDAKTIGEASTFLGAHTITNRWDDYFFKGLIDEFVVLPEAFSAEEVKQLRDWTLAGNVLPTIPNDPALLPNGKPRDIPVRGN